jgi:NAD-dependent deacetylase
MTELPEALATLLDDAREGGGPLVWLTGAGISAESGIPTFRGAEGYWTVGSEHYHPQEMATRATYDRMPEEVWRWYLYRRSVCRAAAPNAAHEALVRLEEGLGDRFLLITQNVDGLHQRAGSQRIYAIHGDLELCRCGHDGVPRPLPEGLPETWDKDRPMDAATLEALRCCEGGALSRPHVLWFDESYSEELFRFESSLQAAIEASLLVVVGTSGSTNLPLQVGAIVAQRGASMVVINRDESPFTRFADESERGYFWKEDASAAVPAVVDRLMGS